MYPLRNVLNLSYADDHFMLVAFVTVQVENNVLDFNIHSAIRQRGTYSIVACAAVYSR